MDKSIVSPFFDSRCRKERTEMQLLRGKFDFIEVLGRLVLQICRLLMNAVNAWLLTRSAGRPLFTSVAPNCSHSRKSISIVLPESQPSIPSGDVTALVNIRD